MKSKLTGFKGLGFRGVFGLARLESSSKNIPYAHETPGAMGPEVHSSAKVGWAAQTAGCQGQRSRN